MEEFLSLIVIMWTVVLGVDLGFRDTFLLEHCTIVPQTRLSSDHPSRVREAPKWASTFYDRNTLTFLD